MGNLDAVCNQCFRTADLVVKFSCCFSTIGDWFQILYNQCPRKFKLLMENSLYFEIENLWERLLSRQPELIRAAFQSLRPEEQQDVQAHLLRMVSETGWHPEQVASAQAALDSIRGDR
jgi:hypothetical protein